MSKKSPWTDCKPQGRTPVGSGSSRTRPGTKAAK